MNGWVEVKAFLQSAPQDWSIFADAFDQHGCPGSLQTDSPATITGYVVDTPGAEAVVEAIAATLKGLGASKVEIRRIPYEDWSSIWKQHFKPIRIGSRIVVRPSWEATPPTVHDIEIVLDPGQAFGTGDHPTTRMCLELLETFVGPQTGRLLDLGSGSGILAIAAKKLGAKHVDATDIDPIAIDVCNSNCRVNGVDVVARVVSGFEDPVLSAEWDVVVSNIISATLIRLAPEAAKRVAVGGRWIVSGILESNWQDVLKAIVRTGLELEVERKEMDWTAAAFRKPPVSSM